MDFYNLKDLLLQKKERNPDKTAFAFSNRMEDV